MDKVWERICSKMKKDLGQDSYQNWIKPLEYMGVKNGLIEFGVPTVFIGNWVERNYGEKISKYFEGEEIHFSGLKFKLLNQIKTEFTRVHPSAKVSGNPKSLSIFSRGSESIVLPSSPLDKRFTFDRFVVGKPNELAHAAARRVSEGGTVTFNPLFLYGGVGLGKTHLMHAIAWEMKNLNANARMLYLSAEQFMYRFVQALRFKDMHGFKELFRSVDVLMVDDVQFIAGKESTQDEFFHTFNALVDHGKQIVISACICCICLHLLAFACVRFHPLVFACIWFHLKHIVFILY